METVRVTVMVVPPVVVARRGLFIAVAEVPPKVTEEAEKLQPLSEGRPEHKEGERLIVPVKPLRAVKVSTVEPVLPGLGTMIVCGLADTPKSGPGVTVSIKVAKEDP